MNHPGVYLKQFIDDREISCHELSLSLKVPANRITDIVRGKRNISAKTAILLGDFFNVDPKVWMDYQVEYDLYIARKEMEN